MSGLTGRLDEPVFPIRTVAELTGVPSGTLRAWERRYGFVRPERSASGHRLYSRRDIERLHRATALIESGVSLSRVHRLLGHEASGSVLADDTDSWLRWRRALVGQVERFDVPGLETSLARGLLGPEPAIAGARFMAPLLRDLALRWRIENRTTEQRLLETVLRYLLARGDSADGRVAPILGTVSPEDTHEIGLLMFAVLASRSGLPMTIIGGGAPVGELAAARRRMRCPAILLYAHGVPDRPALLDSLAGLVGRAGCPVFVAGPAIRLAAARLSETGAVPLNDDPAAAFGQLASAACGTR